MLRIDAVNRRTELPSPLDRLLLEVIAKRKVAEHLEKRVMPCRAAHVLDVIGANAFLGAGGSRRGPLLLAQKNGLKRQHPSNGEQHRGIVRNQRGTWHPFVPTLCIKTEKGFTDLLTRARRGGCRTRRSCNGHGRQGGSSRHDRP